MADPDPDIVTTCGILLLNVVGAVATAVLVGWPDFDEEEEC